MMSPRDLVKGSGFGRSIDVYVIGAHDISGGGTGHKGCSCQVIVVHLGLAKDAGFSSSSCSVFGVHLAVRPLCVAQKFGSQCRVQGKEGLDQGGLSL